MKPADADEEICGRTDAVPGTLRDRIRWSADYRHKLLKKRPFLRVLVPDTLIIFAFWKLREVWTLPRVVADEKNQQAPTILKSSRRG